MDNQSLYLKSRIHPYPGLGHQVSAWLSGALWARDLELKYIGGEITRNEGALLRLTNGGEEGVSPLGRRVAHVALPPTRDERFSESLDTLRGFVEISRRRHKNADAIVFTSALDNPRWNQVPAESDIRGAILAGSHGDLIRKRETDGQLRIAVHVRRGDIGRGSIGRGAGISRWVPEEWYVQVIRNLRGIPGLTAAQVRVVSLGVREDFPMLSELPGTELCLNRDSGSDLVELASADVLVTAPSSFSFTAALASRGLVLAPYPWWHEVPEEGRWFRLDKNGDFDSQRLETMTRELSIDRNSSR